MNFNQKQFKYIMYFLIILLFLLFLIYARTSLFPFILGILMAYLFNPFIKYMKKRNFSRNGAILILIIIVFNIIFISGLFLAPILLRELNHLTEYIPEYISEIDETIKELNERYQQIHLPHLLEEVLNQFLDEVESYMMDIIHRMTEYLFSSIPFLFSVILSPIITYYILRDLENIKKFFIQVVPDDKRKICSQLSSEVNKIFIGYFRGQIWISFFVGIMGIIGLFLLDVQFYLNLGILAGITNMIPYIGPIIGAIP
ncbi:MAG: AI-2E family transporter, partial [Halanaerobiales bacterium]